MGKAAADAGLAATLVPTGDLLRLRPTEVRPNVDNPRMLFDPEPLNDLKENIRVHGVLVPITVYRLPGSRKYAILDGARRHKCAMDLESEGLTVDLPANVVQPPDKLASLLYMFSIHNFREQWELMPTALSLKIVIEELGESDSKKLSHLTGLSEPQVERCKKLLDVPEHLQALSLDPNPQTRIPSNFWIEAYPVLDIIAAELPEVWADGGESHVLEKLVDKYRMKRIKSVIHFRRIVEACNVAEDDADAKRLVVTRLKEYVEDPTIETRRAFDEFIVDSRRVNSALRACEAFTSQLQRARVEHSIDEERQVLIKALNEVRELVAGILQKLEGSDPPADTESAEVAL